MIALLALTALSAFAGEIDVDDLDHWRGQTDRMLHGPEGCWAFSGGGAVTLALYTPAGAFTRAGEHSYRATGTFSGFLRDGRWTQLHFTETGEGAEEEEVDQDGVSVQIGGRGENFDLDFEPSLLFGERRRKRAEAGSEGAAAAAGSAVETANLIDRLLESIDPSITTSYAQYNQEAEVVEFVQHVPFSDKARSKEVTVRTLFPEGGTGTAVDVLFPRRINLTELAEDEDDRPPFKVMLMDAQAHLRSQTFADGTVLPAAETVSAVVGALGFTVGWEQRLVYTEARPCTAEEAAQELVDGETVVDEAKELIEEARAEAEAEAKEEGGEE